MSLFAILLFIHVLGAIIAFGASYSTFPLLGAMSGKEPAHGNFGARVSHAISARIVRPLAILQGITGVALIVVGSIDLTQTIWLDVAIVLYVIAIGYALFVQIPLGERLVQLTSGGPPPATVKLLLLTPRITRSPVFSSKNVPALPFRSAAVSFTAPSIRGSAGCSSGGRNRSKMRLA